MIWYGTYPTCYGSETQKVIPKIQPGQNTSIISKFSVQCARGSSSNLPRVKLILRCFSKVQWGWGTVPSRSPVSVDAGIRIVRPTIKQSEVVIKEANQGSEEACMMRIGESGNSRQILDFGDYAKWKAKAVFDL